MGLATYLLLTGDLYWSVAIPLTAGAMLSVPIATLTVRRLPERLLRGSVGVATCALGLLMIIKVLG